MKITLLFTVPCLNAGMAHRAKHNRTSWRPHTVLCNRVLGRTSLPRCARAEARANGEGFVWDKVDRYWWVSINNASRYINGPDGQQLSEEDITDELVEEVVCNSDLGASD